MRFYPTDLSGDHHVALGTEELEFILDCITHRMADKDLTEDQQSMGADMEIKILNEVPVLRQQEHSNEFLTEADDEEFPPYVRSIPANKTTHPKWHKRAGKYSTECHVLVLDSWPTSEELPPDDERHCFKCFPERSTYVGDVLCKRNRHAVTRSTTTGTAPSCSAQGT